MMVKGRHTIFTYLSFHGWILRLFCKRLDCQTHICRVKLRLLRMFAIDTCQLENIGRVSYSTLSHGVGLHVGLYET